MRGRSLQRWHLRLLATQAPCFLRAVTAMTMIRKQFPIDRPTSEKLRRLAAKRGVAEAELIRLGIDALLAQEAAPEEEIDWKQQLAKFIEASGALSAAADRIERNKALQARRWRQRMKRNRKQFDGT